MGKIKCKFDKRCCLTPCPNGQHPMVGSASCRACKFYYSGGKDFVLCELTRHSLKTIEAKKTPRKPVKKVSVASRAHNTGSPKLRQTIELVNSVICGLDDPVFAKDIDVIKFRLKNVVSQLSGNA